MNTKFAVYHLRIAIIVSMLFAFLGTSPAYAAGIVGTGMPESCNEAALDAALTGGGIVTFNCGALPVTIPITSSKIILADTAIDGGNLITISGAGSVRVFDVAAAGVTLDLNNLTVTDGFDASVAGAIFNSAGGTVNVTNSTFSYNRANGSGGAIVTHGIVNINNSVFSSNGGLDTYGGAISIIAGTVNIAGSTFSNNKSGAAGGGAILNLASLNIISSTFSDNSHFGSDGGGAIYNDGGTTNIISSTFINNSTTNQGGAILNGGGFGTSPLTIANSTFYGNTAGTLGGAIHNGCIADVACIPGISGNSTIINSTFSTNGASAGGNLNNNAGTVGLANTIIADSSSGGNCTGPITDNGSNLQFGDISCGDGILVADPLLSSLANNGGPTQTIALSLGSPAIDTGNDIVCSLPPVNNVDQRSVTRPQGGACDIGAFEFQATYDFGGFFQPVDNLPTLNLVKAGSAIPVKFTLGGDQGLDIFEAGYPKSQQIACDSSTLIDGIEQTVTAGSSSLSYDPITNQYTYVWKTDKIWGNTCRQLVVKLNDGTYHRASFKFK